MDSQTLEKPDAKTDDGSGNKDKEPAHYVRKDAIVDAIVEGNMLVALCGEVFSPVRDVKERPVCQACKDIYDKMKRGD